MPPQLKVLGSLVSPDAGSAANFVELKGKIMQAFFVNVGEGSDAILSGAKPSERIRLFETSTTGIVKAAAAALCYSNPLRDRLDKLQLDFMCQMCPYKKPQSLSWPQLQKM